MTPVQVLIHKRNEWKLQISELTQKRYENDSSVGSNSYDKQLKSQIDSLSRLIYKCNKSIKYLKTK